MTQPKVSNAPTSAAMPAVWSLLEAVCARAEKAGVFGKVTLDSGRLACRAANSAEPAEYRIDVQDGKLWVSLVTNNRWLSQSIEQDLVHTGDKIPELVDEELADVGFDVKAAAARGWKTTFEHFRSEDKLFTFRTPLPIALADAGNPASIEAAAQHLLAYEACFRRLGDMDAGDEDGGAE
ncbi:MAG: hypothetical protein IT438_14050 [Phycisphaerales bacterium]|nr:hypothetical protein [Phycisphaerales bacterium]